MKSFKNYLDLNESNDRAKECYQRAKKEGYSKELEDCIIKYDKDGRWCYEFALDIKGANFKRLEDAIIKKDPTGRWCCDLARFGKRAGADIKKLQDVVIQKDPTGQWVYYFAYFVKKADIEKLGDAVLQKDKTGYWSYKFWKLDKKFNRKQFLQKIKKKFGENNKYYKEAIELLKSGIYDYLKK